jgi:AraC family transcriptional regulator
VEVQDGTPWVHSAGSVVLHSADEEHADYFTSAGRCLNVKIGETSIAVSLDVVAADPESRRATCDVVRAVSAQASAVELPLAVGKLQGSLDALARAPQAVFPVWLSTIINRFPWTAGAKLNEAAKLAGVHPVHFSREFQRYLRMTPTVFRRRARVRRATQLLLLTDARLSSIALECGFSDQSHFTREFRLATGLAPDSFRRIFAR